MTISSTVIKNSYNGNGSTTAFTFTYYIIQEEDLEVIIRSSSGGETTKTLNTDYTVTGVQSNSGGTVTMTTAPAIGETVVIRRNTAKIQDTDYVANDPFPAEVHEAALDKQTIISQEIQEEVDRSIKLSRTNTIGSTEFTIGATDRANKILAFDSSGELSVTQNLGTFLGDWSSSRAYNVRDIVKDTTNENLYICNTAHTSSGSLPINTNTDSSKWTLFIEVPTVNQTRYVYTATASQTTFTGTDDNGLTLDYTPPFVDVYLNGIKLVNQEAVIDSDYVLETFILLTNLQI